MMIPSKVSFIGSGNLAWHLAPALDNTEFSVREVYSRNPSHAKSLADHLYQAEVKTSLDFSGSPSGIFIIAVSDDAILEVLQEIILPDNALLIHTSGSQPLSVLSYGATEKTGVFYPLQTFTKGRKVDFREIPIFIESEDPETEKVLMTLAKGLSKKCLRISSQERKALHIAAVFASNFSNYMLHLAEEVLQNQKLDFDLLKPLITETINKSLVIGPAAAQTGPAKRGDLEVLDKHMEYLAGQEDVAEIYRLISQHIVDRYHG